ncbi:Scr1 family TA system antitoxin-like transcriptional regulator [Actinophytocola sp.]|uniref:Scr1 family TA system antitoxin-like transcriptional regulator n=1 Tax=Actinophytocola sp. TaxID=1872138 RepID=UPI00389A7316
MVANWELVLRLKERREQVGVSVNDLTNEFRFTRNYWSAIENERKIVPEKTLRSLFTMFEFSEEDCEQLLQLREIAKENGWWNQYSALFDGELQRLFGLEHGAQGIRDYETLLIPGLLQTAEYARAIMNSDATVRQVEVEQRVAVRLRRQERLRGGNPAYLTVIMSEAALRQQIGGRAVLRGQLEHLLATMEEFPDNVEIRVIPFAATACTLFGAGTMRLLDFHSPRLPRVAWLESVSTRAVITDPTRVRDITIAFNEALERTLDTRRTKETINRCRKELT